MGLLLNEKMNNNPNYVSIGDKVFYLKKDRFDKGIPEQYHSGCTFITDIVLKNSEKILTLEGSAPVSKVRAIYIVAYEEETQLTYKIRLELGEFTYSMKNWVQTIATIEE